MNKIARVLMTGSLIWYFGEGMLGPLFAIFAQQIGGDILDITWAWAIYLLLTGIIMIFIGKLSDEKISKELLMIIGYSLNAIFTFGYLFVSSPQHLFLIQAGLGISWALATPTWDALYSKHEDRKNAGTAWGFADGLPQIITGISILIGGFIISYFSFKTLFLIMGSIQVIATLYQIRIFWMKK